MDSDAQWATFSFWAFVSHLVMALVMIAASYIGWSKSRFSFRDSELASVFSWGFAELLLDVLLVIAYFVLVHQSEYPVSQGGSTHIAPSLIPEARWVSAVFFLYLAWDLVSKWPYRKDPDTRAPIGWAPLRQRAWISILLMVLAVVSWQFVASAHASADEVIAYDLAMVGLIALFRELKARIGGQLERDPKGGHLKVFKDRFVIASLIMYALPIGYIVLKPMPT